MDILLIAASAFAPCNVIGAIRWSKICKYIATENIHIHVIAYRKHALAYDETLTNDVKVCDMITYLGEDSSDDIVRNIYRFVARITRRPYSDEAYNSARLTNKWLRLVNYMGFAKETRSYLRKHDGKYDIVISTNPISAHWGALFAARKYRIPWIADFRDPIASMGDNGTIYGRWIVNWQKKICEKADSVIAVSQGLREVLCMQRQDLLSKTSVIYNGFDPADYMEDTTSTDGKIHLVYTGILYTGKRDLSPVFEALRNLCDKGVFSKDKLVFDYAGKEYRILSEQAAKYQMEDIIINHGFVTRSESLSIQSKADILVMATYNDEGNPGVMPGKLYEYMMMRKPILAVVSGVVRDSELKQVINECDVGLCHETNFDDIDKMQDFIEMVVKSHNTQEPMQLAYRIDRFDYRNIANQVKKLVNATLDKETKNAH